RRPRARGGHARLPPARAAALPGGDGDAAVSRHTQEPQAATAARGAPAHPLRRALRSRSRATDRAPERDLRDRPGRLSGIGRPESLELRERRDGLVTQGLALALGVLIGELARLVVQLQLLERLQGRVTAF